MEIRFVDVVWDARSFIAALIGLNIWCVSCWLFKKATKPWRDRMKSRNRRRRIESKIR